MAGETVSYTIAEVRIGVLALIQLRDSTGATSMALATVTAGPDSLAQVLACASPGGLGLVPVAISSFA